jgi:hypothetical protein
MPFSPKAEELAVSNLILHAGIEGTGENKSTNTQSSRILVRR